MTEEQTKEAILEYIKTVLNNKFTDGVPTPITLAVEKIHEGLENKSIGVSSESLNGDISVSYSDLGVLMTNPDIFSLLSPYKRMKW